MDEENNTQPRIGAEGDGKRRTVWIAVTVMTVLVAGFFIFADKNGDNTQGMPLSEENESVRESEVMKNKDGGMMESSLSAKHVVKYTDTGFVPTALEIASGETVTFVNESGSDMWIASGTHPAHEILPEFDQMKGTPKGSAYSFTFIRVGTWKFHDHFNPSANGTVTVK